MILASNIKMAITFAAVLTGPLALTNQPRIAALISRDLPALMELAPGTLSYRAAGEFTRDGRPAAAPLVTARIARPLAIMKTQVTAGDYQKCVDDRACAPLPAAALTQPDRPAVQVSWQDAQNYAAWLSRKTGRTFRLPTDEEWAYAAGSRWRDDAVRIDPNDPSQRSLARYDRESQLKDQAATDGLPRPVGSFGANERGLLDLSGNVWEWTDTCFTRTKLDEPHARTVNCGVRTVEGQHRTYVTDFIRDARAGGCAAGVPPSNLGFRLVAERNSDVARR